MVAITVILAAVIGAFVLEIGDQQETAPSTSFDSSEYDYLYDADPSNPQLGPNMTMAEFSHAGGEVIDRRQVQSKVNGNPTTFTGLRRKGTSPTSAVGAFPAIQLTRGDNAVRTYQEAEPRDEEWTSGESFKLWSYGFAWRTSTLENYEKSYAGMYECIASQSDSNNRYQFASYDSGARTNIDYEEIHVADVGNVNECHFMSNLLQGGDTVTVVWSATSGGKTQTLFKYDVQG
jgi:hypothetical protein